MHIQNTPKSVQRDKIRLDKIRLYVQEFTYLESGDWVLANT